MDRGKQNFVQQLSPEESGQGKVRRGITKEPALVRALARKKYLEQSIALLEKNIPALERLLNARP